MAQSSLEIAELIVKTMGEVAISNRTYFSELDGVVGDGDFGNSIATGFEAVTVTKWDSRRGFREHLGNGFSAGRR